MVIPGPPKCPNQASPLPEIGHGGQASFIVSGGRRCSARPPWRPSPSRFGLSVVQSPPDDPVRRAVVRPALAVGRLLGVGDDRPPIADAIRRVGQGDENARTVAVLQLRYIATDSSPVRPGRARRWCSRCVTNPGPSRTPPCPCSAT